MPVAIKTYPNLIWICLEGEVTSDAFIQHAGEVARLENQGAESPNRFTDLSECTSFPDFIAMSDFAALRSEAKLKNRVKSAVYAGNDFQYAMGRMFQRMNTNPLIEVQVFRDKKEALTWVGAETAGEK